VKKILFSIAAAALLAGCQPMAVSRVDPYEGLLAPGKHPTQAAQQLPIAGRGRTVAVVISNSTEKQFQYVKESIKTVRESPLLRSTEDSLQKVEPDYLVQRILAKLREHFGPVQSASDFGQAIAQRADYIALVDIAIALPAGFDHSFTYQVDVDLLNPQVERIGSFHGDAHQGYFCMEYACAEKAQSIAIEGALGQYDAAVDAGVH
jgi:hypothetical protein